MLVSPPFFGDYNFFHHWIAFQEENIGNSVEDTQPLYQAEEIQFPVMNMGDVSGKD